MFSCSNGGRGFAFTLGLSLVNFCVKPVKATQQHMAATHPGGPASERYAAISKGVAVGVLSGLGSLCFGIPSSVFLLLSASCVGALNQIQAVPMLDSVKFGDEKRASLSSEGDSRTRV